MNPATTKPRPIRKKWESPNNLPLSMKTNTDSDYYSDSFESYSSDVQSSTLSEILTKIDNLSSQQVTKLLDYVKELSQDT